MRMGMGIEQVKEASGGLLLLAFAVSSFANTQFDTILPQCSQTVVNSGCTKATILKQPFFLISICGSF